MSDNPANRDVRAAEYVLGLMTSDEARAVKRDAEDDMVLAQAIARWEERLAPLANAVEAVKPPPGVWLRIAKDLPLERAAVVAEPPPRPSIWESLALWRSSTAGGFALAVALGLLLFARPAIQNLPVEYHGAILPIAQPAATWMAETMPDGRIKLTMMAPAPHPTDRDLELWALPKGAPRPIPMGVMPASGVMMVAGHNMPMKGLQLLISLEPHGGSPTGQPTGPVLYGGMLTEVNRS